MLQLAEFHADPKVQEQFELFHQWTRLVQQNDDGFGYTRFDLVNGKPDYNWMSPQYDGFAFRALAFIKYAKNCGVRYDDVIKQDLDSILKVWNRNDGYEPWEEVVGEHYMVLLVHMEALFQGSHYFNDELYLETAILIKNNLKRFYNGEWIKSTLNGYCKENDKNEGARTKVQLNNFIDISSVLGLNIATEPFRTEYESLQTFYELVNSFAYNQHSPPIKLSSWALNNVTCSSDGYEMAPGIGRYPEDIFDGIGYMFEGKYKSFGAGFWFLATNAMAEFLFKLIHDYENLEMVEINEKSKKFWEFIGIDYTGQVYIGDYRFDSILDAIFIKADSFIHRTKEYVIDGYMSEQFHYLTGSQMSTSDLSWSYASIISVNSARRKVLRNVEPKRCNATAYPTCPLPCKNHCGFPKNQPRCVARNAEECHSLGCCWVQRDILHPVCMLSLDQPSRIGTIFEVEHHVEYGQTLSVVGTFNDWDTCSGLECQWTLGDIWKCPGFIGSKKEYQVKAIVYTDCSVVEWQKGENIKFTTTGKPQLIKFKF
ncbi:glycoside hydrolase 15 protein [Boothiomyces macroporosus]|uniref:glucan 1,4-alpha-glucosidase n=1 Tax=Boothiomyces macroporosus TaxID=261099 RepID=A0AAD5UMN2_9FUNG|nr:glycoside hydrolase 15 protein [Boothiomyces macroporosus]